MWMVLHANVWLGYKESVDSQSLTSLDLVGTRNGDVFVNENPWKYNKKLNEYTDIHVHHDLESLEVNQNRDTTVTWWAT